MLYSNNVPDGLEPEEPNKELELELGENEPIFADAPEGLADYLVLQNKLKRDGLA